MLARAQEKSRAGTWQGRVCMLCLEAPQASCTQVQMHASVDCGRVVVANNLYKQGCYLGRSADAQRPGGPAQGGCCMQCAFTGKL